jgi:hypothetical protein
MYPLERQPRSACRSHQRQNQISEPERNDGDEEEGLGTPWSWLKTVAKEHCFGERGWEDDEMVGDDEGIGRNCEDGNGCELECDGLEVGGEPCLRHESCRKEAMALGGE